MPSWTLVMCAEGTTFGAEPQDLDRLIALGLEGMEEDAALPIKPEVEGPGTRVGRYQLLRVLGEGGMAVVYLAEQTEPIHRKVALKIIKLGMDTRQVIARFEAERQALALMDHPHIAKVFDAGATETGRPYFVMEWVQGASITEYCDRSTLSTEDRLALFLQVCRAVQHAHQKGIIHRDLKPSNVLVTLVDGTPVPKIIDFGIAKATAQRLTEETFSTGYGHLVGTPAYMSPEQADSNEVDIDTRSDIYSLGVLLYELLTGVTPFGRAELRKAGHTEMQRVIREQVPVRPSTKLGMLGETLADVAQRRRSSPDLLRKTLRGDLDWIVMKTLEKDRSRRYETVSGLAEDIRRHREHEPILARGPGTTYRLLKFLRRHRSQVFVVVALTVIIATAGGVFSLWNRVHLQLAQVEDLRYRDLLSQAHEQYAKGDHQAALKTIQAILRRGHVDPEAQFLYASLLVEGRLPEEAMALLKQLVSKRPAIAGAAHALWARLLWENEALTAERLQEIEEHRRQAAAALPETAEAYFLQAMTAMTVKEQLALLDKAVELDGGHYESRRLRAFLYYALGKYEAMEHDAFAMIVVRQRDPLAYCLHALACHHLGRYPESVAEYDRAFGLMPATDPQYAELYGRRVEALWAMGQYERVLADAQECLKQVPNAVELNAQVFCAFTILGRYDEASALMQRLVGLAGNTAGQVHRRTMKYVLDTLVAGRRWHPPDRAPKGPAFFYMFETEEMYQGLSAKACQLIAQCFCPCWSPDGTKIAYAQGFPGCTGIGVYDLSTRETNLLVAPGREPSWSSDGRHVTFIRDMPALRVSELTLAGTRRGSESYEPGEELWVMNADGSAPRRLACHAHGSGWSADGRHLYYRSRDDQTVYSIAVDDLQAQPVPLCAGTADHPIVSPDGSYLADMEGTVLRIKEVTTQSCVAEWPVPLEAPIYSWSPDGRELSLGSLNGIRDRTGLWVYDRTKKEALKVLRGHFGGASWSPDRRRLLVHLSPMFAEAWIADLDPNLPTAESLKPVQTFQEHCQECIVAYTRDLEVAPDAFVSHWARVTAALWIGHPEAADYLQELDHPPLEQSGRYAHAAQDILLHPALYQRLAPLAWVLARRAVEQQPSYANDLAPAFERQGQYEHAARLRQMAQTGPRHEE